MSDARQLAFVGVCEVLDELRDRNPRNLGDFHDLGSLAETLAPYSDFLLITPLQAAEPLAAGALRHAAG